MADTARITLTQSAVDGMTLETVAATDWVIVPEKIGEVDAIL
jgi:hypothetical protein